MLNKIDITLRFVSRLAFTGLLIFEVSNYFNILHYDLDFTWLGLIWTLIAVWLALEIMSVHLKNKCKQLLPGIIFVLATAMIYFDALGDVFHLYGNYEWYDQIMHLLGGATPALIFFYIIQIYEKCGFIKLSQIVISIFAFALAVSAGAIFEIEEYLEDLITGSSRLGDGFDTANDLLLGLLGAVIVLILVNVFLNSFSSKKK